jgi:hypothetical protein
VGEETRMTKPYTAMDFEELEQARLALIARREPLTEQHPDFAAVTLELDHVIRLQYQAGQRARRADPTDPGAPDGPCPDTPSR